MNIAIIIPVFHQWDRIPILISRLGEIETSNGKVEFILVDNEPGTNKNVEGVNLIECHKPGSYAARNAGIRSSIADLYIFTDADCFPDEQWLEKFRDAYEQSDGETLLAGNVIIKSQNGTSSTPELYDMALGLPQERYVSKGYAVTANLAVPRKVFDSIGCFDESRFSGGDADFCQRAIKAGYKLQFVPEAIVYHPARKTWQEFATKVRRMKGGQIRAGSLQRRIKYGLITLLPPVWRFWRTCRSDKLTSVQKCKVVLFQIRLWFVEVIEMFALLSGKQPERR